MPKTDNSNKPFRITSPPKDVSDFVFKRIQKSLRTIPKELIAIIREFKEIEEKREKRRNKKQEKEK